MRRNEAHNSFLLIYASSKVHCCLSSDTIFNLQLWVIIIISCRLFLHHDEFHDLSGGNFVPSLFAIFLEGIEHLGLWVCGKADKGVKKYLKVVTD